jgi:hypothetical protein
MILAPHCKIRENYQKTIALCVSYMQYAASSTSTSPQARAQPQIAPSHRPRRCPNSPVVSLEPPSSPTPLSSSHVNHPSPATGGLYPGGGLRMTGTLAFLFSPGSSDVVVSEASSLPSSLASVVLVTPSVVVVVVCGFAARSWASWGR